MRIFLLCAAVAVLICSCNPTHVLSPNPISTLRTLPPDSTSPTRVTAIVGNGNLEITMKVRLPQPDCTYQCLLNTDGISNNHYAGYEYVVRGPGIDPAGLVVRNMNFCSCNPGGWGDVTGYFTQHGNGNFIRVTIPLSALGGRVLPGRNEVIFTVDGAQVSQIYFYISQV